jgi:hypothetical protein
MLLLWWCPIKIQKEKLPGLQFMTTDYLSLVLTPLRIRWTIPLRPFVYFIAVLPLTETVFGKVPFQAAIHSQSHAGEKPDSNLGLQDKSLVCYQWATTSPLGSSVVWYESSVKNLSVTGKLEISWIYYIEHICLFLYGSGSTVPCVTLRIQFQIRFQFWILLIFQSKT